jgi:hypothetical protein
LWGHQYRRRRGRSKWKGKKNTQCKSRLLMNGEQVTTVACHRTQTLDKSRRGANAASISSNGHLYD